MRNYIYKLKDDNGKTMYGFMDAQNPKDLKQRLRKSNYYFISAQPHSREAIFRKRVPLEELLMFTRRLYSLIDSGIPILTVMRILWRQTESKTLQLVVSHIHRMLSEGRTIAEALEQFPNIFSLMYRSMIAVAEKTGRLADILSQLSKFLETQKNAITRTKKATLYPLIVILFANFVLFFMFAFVVPTFQKVLLKLNVELPLLTRIVMGISNLIRSWQFFAFLIILGMMTYFTYRYFRKKEKFSYYADEIKLKTPFFGHIWYLSTLSRFVHSLSMLMNAGLPIIESFQVARETSTNKKINYGIDQVQRNVEQGGSLYDSFKDVPIFPVLLIEMIGVGESSGSMVPVLDNLATHFDDEVEYKQNKIFTIMEPALIIIVGVIVIVSLLAIYLPIFSIWQGLLK